MSRPTHVCGGLRAGNGYPALDGANNRPGFCFDTALLLPEFNPMAVPLPDASWAGNGGLVASPLSTVLVFAASSGEHQATSCLGLGVCVSLLYSDCPMQVGTNHSRLWVFGLSAL